jgi:hypothetical protein
MDNYRKNFIPGADANDLILQMRTWESHDVGALWGHPAGSGASPADAKFLGMQPTAH